MMGCHTECQGLKEVKASKKSLKERATEEEGDW